MTDALALYKKKRNFTVTPEPEEGGAPGREALQYVIQKHWASRLHYDLRLELDGTMKSWAVPKGPSLDPADKRMAVQVEDHPIAYNRFEGQIPPGQYGAGRVIVWDRGDWVPLGDPAEGYRKGKLQFEIRGHKLGGQWTLVRMRGKGDERQPAWLLIKEKDGFARSAAEFSVTEEMPESVAALTSEPQHQARRKKRVTPRDRRQAPDEAPLPESLPPQLATLVEGPPADMAQWLWELKFDGYRVAARIDNGVVRLVTRNGHDWTAKMPELAKALEQLPLRSGWLDGEVIMLDAHGIPDFQMLQNAFDGSATQDLVYYLFDMPFADGQDLRHLAVTERRELLRALVKKSPVESVRFSEAFEVLPEDLVASACKLGFEGVIGKRKSAPYASRRNTDWIKLKCTHRQEFVIGGFTDPKGSRSGIGSLLLGVHATDGSLQYAGNVGTGFSERTLAELRARLEALTTSESPFANTCSIGKKAHWVQPKLLAEVAFAEWTQQGRIRHSVFHGLRADKPPRKITREEPKPLAAPVTPPTQGVALPPTLRVSHPDRVVDPSSSVTKIELVQYYANVAPLIMEHLRGRPVAIVRAPEGVKGSLFFQKHSDHNKLPGIEQLDPALHSGHEPLLEVVRPEGLLSAAQMNAIEFHTWNARKDRIDRPDRMTFDLDPGEGVSWEQVQEGAQLVRVLLGELGLPAFLKTSGGKGLHVVVPIKRMHDWDTVKGFSQAVVQHLARTIPQRFVSKSGPRNRIGKIFVDYLRNGWGATTVSAWSVRARPGLGVSVPIAWSELESLTSSAHWHIRNVGERVSLGNAPWGDYGKAAVSIAVPMKRLG